MPSSQPISRFNDIIFNIERIGVYLNGFTFEDFANDPRTIDAVERCITEAAIKLQPKAAELLPDQDWDTMRGFGNVLRHDYDVVLEKMIWDIAQNFLTDLRSDCRRTLWKGRAHQIPVLVFLQDWRSFRQMLKRLLRHIAVHMLLGHYTCHSLYHKAPAL